MKPNLIKSLGKALEDVVDLLIEAGWEDEAEWYDDLRQGLLTLESSSPQFTELLVELEQSLLGMGTFTDIPLDSKVAEATEKVALATDYDLHHQRLGLISCTSGIIHEIKKSTWEDSIP